MPPDREEEDRDATADFAAAAATAAGAEMSETKLLIGSDMIASKDMLNPFVHHLELTSTYDKFKVKLFRFKKILNLVILYQNVGLDVVMGNSHTP